MIHRKTCKNLEHLPKQHNFKAGELPAELFWPDGVEDKESCEERKYE